MAHTVQTEIERKYTVVEGAALPDLTGVGAESSAVVARTETLEPFSLEAVYFDTADGALAAQRIALRRRSGGHDEGWHVKLPAAEGRTELQWPLTTGREETESDSVPAEVVAAVLVHVRDRPLTPLARVETTRRVTNLLDGTGAVLAEIADDEVAATDAREGTARLWREWEVELGEAAPGTPEARTALLDAVEERLRSVGATLSPSVSKLAQALGRTGLGAAGSAGSGSAETAGAASRASTASGASGASGTPVTPAEGSAAAVVTAGIGELVAQVIDLDPAVRADDDDAVHRLRTTVRRLRNALATHRALYDEPELESVRDSLSRFGAVLGETRDLEVRLDWAAEALDDLASDRGVDDPDARRRLVDDTRAEHDAAHQRLVAAMSSAPYFRLLDALDAFAAAAPVVDGAAAPGAPTPRKEAKKALRKTGRRALKREVRAREARRVLGPDIVAAASALGALHDARKAARRLRHAAEFSTTGAAGVLGGRAEELGDRAEELQDALGWHRDASLFAEFVLLTSRRAEAAGESSFTYGVLYQRSVDQARRALELADDARRALKRAL
jgi:CHAD domain-containing protein